MIGFIDLELCTLRIDFALSALDADLADKETTRQSVASINVGLRGTQYRLQDTTVIA